MRLIGTAGHIDHGKSTLVQALTGIHPSHLPEEHAREMTIDLGYAYLEHPDGYRLGVVDVPGHERLVKNMVAGATGFELALWVVDAREGVMPQSLEHLQILDLLGVRALVPVLTKAELASEEQMAAARAEVEDLLTQVRAPVHPMHVVDSLSGRGIPELKQAIFSLCGAAERAHDDQLPYLPVDRVFTLKGIGTVVTGTLMRGRLREGDTVSVSSVPGTWRVRSLNNHHTRVREIGAGHRVGINLAGLEAGAVRRGDTLVAPEYPYATRFLNARLHLLEGVPFEWKHGLRALFYAGAVELECRLWGLEREDGSAWVQIQLPREAHFFPGQRFILRSTNPLVTVGGGEVLDLSPDRPRHTTAAERVAYASRERGEAWLGEYVAGSGDRIFELSALARRWMVAEPELERQAVASPVVSTNRGSDSEPARGLVWRTELGHELLRRLHELAGRQARGERLVPYGKLGRELGARTPSLYALLQALRGLDHPAAAFLREHARLDRSGLVLFPGRIAFNAEEQRVADLIVKRLRVDGLRPPRARNLLEPRVARRDVMERVLAKLRNAGRVVQVSPDLVLTPAAVEELRRAPLRHRLDGVRAAEFGQALGLSRKYSIPYLEYLNRAGIMRRDGDLHYLVQDGPEEQEATAPGPETPVPPPV